MKEYIAAVHVVTHGADHYNFLIRFVDNHELVEKVREKMYNSLSSICEVWVTVENDDSNYGQELEYLIIEESENEYEREHPDSLDD